MLATASVNALAVGILALKGPSAIDLLVLTAVPFASIISCLIAVGLATERGGDAMIYLLVGLPFLGGFAYSALVLAPRAGSAIGLAFAAIGAAFGALSFRSASERASDRADVAAVERPAVEPNVVHRSA